MDSLLVDKCPLLSTLPFARTYLTCIMTTKILWVYHSSYRYYFLTNQRRLQEAQQRQERRQHNVVTQQPQKADTLKRKMLNKFLETMDKL